VRASFSSFVISVVIAQAIERQEPGVILQVTDAPIFDAATPSD